MISLKTWVLSLKGYLVCAHHRVNTAGPKFTPFGVKKHPNMALENVFAVCTIFFNVL
jgi:hypothetical protein